MKISVVIPNYNGARILQKNLPKVIEAVGDAEMIVVDDTSSDGSIKLLKEKFPRVTLIEKEKNQGFASTVNIGVQHASSEFVLLLNSDVVPEKDFLTPVLSYFKDEKVFAVGLLQKCPEDEKIVLRGRGIGKFERGFLIHARGPVSDKDTSEVAEWTPRMVEDFKKTLWVSGGAGIFRKSIWEKLGGLCELYNPFYWEDIDISYRALKAEYKIFFEPKSVVHHNQGVTIKGKYSSEYVKTIAYRNQFLFVWLNISYWKYLLEHIIHIPLHLLKALYSADFSFIKGFNLALFSIFRILSKRLIYTRLWKKADNEII